MGWNCWATADRFFLFTPPVLQHQSPQYTWVTCWWTYISMAWNGHQHMLCSICEATAQLHMYFHVRITLRASP